MGKTRFSLLDGVKSMMSGNYVQNSWNTDDDAGSLRNDVIDVQTSLALIGSLVLTFAFPMFTAISDANDTYMFMYAFFVAMTIVMESVCVLLSVRNIIVVSLVRSENMSDYVQLAAPTMLFPTRMNFFAVMSMLGALIFYGLSILSPFAVIGFCIVIIIPSVCYLLFHISSGIQALWVVQAWPDNKGKKAKQWCTKQITDAIIRCNCRNHLSSQHVENGLKGVGVGFLHGVVLERTMTMKNVTSSGRVTVTVGAGN